VRSGAKIVFNPLVSRYPLEASGGVLASAGRICERPRDSPGACADTETPTNPSCRHDKRFDVFHPKRWTSTNLKKLQQVQAMFIAPVFTKGYASHQMASQKSWNFLQGASYPSRGSPLGVIRSGLFRGGAGIRLACRPPKRVKPVRRRWDCIVTCHYYQI
jgi:hypothetical protein